MNGSPSQQLLHPNFHRREFLQAGAMAALGGLSLADVSALRAGEGAGKPEAGKPQAGRPKSVIYIVLTGGSEAACARLLRHCYSSHW